MPALVLTCLPTGLSRKPFLNPLMAHLSSLHPGRQPPEPQRASLSLRALGLHAQPRSAPWIVCLCRRGRCGHQVGPRESLRSFRLRRGPSPRGRPSAAPHPPGRDPHCDSGAGTVGSEPLFPRRHVLTKLHGRLLCQGTAAASSP